MTRKYSIFRPTPVAAAVAAVLGTTAIAGFVAPAHAQEADALEEVKVTGSRILRRDLDATSPLVTIGSEAFEGQGTVALETSLNKLPQFVPAVTQFVTTDVQNSATNTVGASTVNLRGIGANRTLVLLDGRRAMPVNATLVVDINTIPSAAIKRVEVITGGASSAYGADAVGGVVNFILKNDFEGMEFDSQYGITELGDDQELRISGLMGGNFADNRGNAMFGVEFFKRGDAENGERDFYTKQWADPSVNGTEFFMSDTYWSPTPGNLPTQTAINTIFTQAGGNGVGTSSSFFANKDGSLYTGGQVLGPVEVDGAYRYNGILDNRFRSLRQDGAIKENQQSSLVSIPAERYSLFGRADYDVTDDVSFFIQGNFSTTHTESVLQFSPAAGGWSVSIPVDAAHPVPTELAALLASRPNPTANWTLNRVLDFIGPRGSINDNKTFQVLAGLNGTLPFGDWTWEAYASHGNTEVSNTLTGFASRERVRALISAPNYGLNAVIQGNPTQNGFAGAVARCTTGLPIFGDFTPSQDCIDAITADMQNLTNMDQNIAEVNFQGGLFDLPAGEVRGAIGADWRENTFSYQVDPLASNDSFLDGPVGLFPTGSVTGSTEVYEAYAELLVPVLADIPAVKRLNLELGYRFSDYDTAGTVDTYKALADWTIIDSLRFRGGYQHANRAPNIGELFLPVTTAVQGTAFGDPCGTNSSAPWGANANVNANSAAARALCTQLMDKASATAAGVFYANPQTGPAATIVTANTVGNQNLKSEVADTLTAGFVFRPAFENKLLSRFTASIDWYNIEIEDAIGVSTFDVIYNQCLNLASNPDQLISNPFCQLITRDPTSGGVATVTGSFLNLGQLETRGVDLNIDWSADLADMGLASVPGAVSVNLATTYLDSYKTQDLATAPVVEYAGTMGPGTGLATATSNSGQYRYKTFTTLGYNTGGFAVSLRWRHLPSADAAAKAANPASPLVGPDSYDIFDLSGNWEINQTYNLRFGVENLFDTDPEIISSNPTPGATFTTGQGMTNVGYYDVLGRRYFVGFKARF